MLKTYSTGNISQPVSVAAGDFNIHYQLDIVLANYDTDGVCLFGLVNGSFINKTCYPSEYNARLSSVFLKDMNNNGWEDIVVSIYGTNNVKILWNTC
jgi:hypothetical protein